MGCVLFMWMFEFVLDHRLDYQRIGLWCLVTTPLLFLLAVELIRRFGPYADGAGIPQVVFASKHMNASTEKSLFPLVAPQTFIVKILALLIGLWAGASTGREGPTVHVATCLFFGVMLLFRKYLKLNFDQRSAIVAGGAAGLAAAFNTPLAGVTFAIEELSVDYFSTFKDYVLMAIIFASSAAISLTGDYTYFGKLMMPVSIPLPAVIAIGVVGGAAGTLFSVLLLKGSRIMGPLRREKGRYWVAPLFSLVVLAIAFACGIQILGPGNQVAQWLVEGSEPLPIYFPVGKMAATLVTYWSGIAGGIFAPCLSVGAALGASMGQWIGISTASCALIGMAAFLSGTIQVPITAFVIIFEMTGYHQMLVPIMLGSLVAFMTARLLKAPHLYQSLSENYLSLLPKGVTSTGHETY